MFGTFMALGGAPSRLLASAPVLYFFAVFLRWLPPSGYTLAAEDPWLSLKMLVMPALVLGTHSAAVIMRQARSALIEVLEQDYITTARAKGLLENAVVAGHALKNAMIPVPPSSVSQSAAWSPAPRSSRRSSRSPASGGPPSTRSSSATTRCCRAQS